MLRRAEGSVIEHPAMSRGGAALRRRRRFEAASAVKTLKRRLPCLVWLPTYTLQALWMDLLSGFTVALTSIPQSIAYSAVAGLPVEYGLYTAFAGPLVYSVFGSVRQITMGATVVMALMTQQYTQSSGAPVAIVLSFLAGCVELLAGLLNLGFLVDFISGPVISGFCSAAAVTVIFSQFKSIFGLRFAGNSFAQVVPGLVANWAQFQLWDTLLGVGCILFLVGLKNVGLVRKAMRCGLRLRWLDSTLWFLATCRNVFAVVLGCLLAYLFHLYDLQPFTLTGEIKAGIPEFRVPPFTYQRPTPYVQFNASSNWTDVLTNETLGLETVTFSQIVGELGAGLALVPIIAILEQVAIAKAFACGRKTDSSQEMVALGLGSLFCSFFGCLPLTASFSRSSVMSSTGNKTPFASFFVSAVILLALSFLMPALSFIPKPVLGAVIIVSVFPMIEFHELVPLWRGRRVELIPLTTTFLCCLLLNMEYGILIGAQVHLLLLAYEASRPVINIHCVDDVDESKLVIRADRNFHFPSAEVIRNALNKAAARNDADGVDRSIVLDMHSVHLVDHTTLKMMRSVMSEWDKKKEKYSLVNVDDGVERTMRSVLGADVAIVGCGISTVTTTVSLGDGSDGAVAVVHPDDEHKA